MADRMRDEKTPRDRTNDPRRDKQTPQGDKPNREPQREALDRAGSPGRTPGSAEGERSDIEEWLKEDSNESDQRQRLP